MIRQALASVAMFCVAPLALAEAWRLQGQDAPDWLSVSGEERYRVEIMDNTFRAIDPGFDQMTSSRFLLAAEARGDHWFAGAELQDSRPWWHDERTPVGTADVNAGEFLQAYVGFAVSDLFGEDDRLSLQAGRMVISMGNQRIVARNGYRNTINGFAGVRATWQGRDSGRVQAFYTRPLERLPDNLDRDALRDNEIENDQSSSERILWGVELSQYPLGGDRRWDLYLLGFEEKDRPSLPARRREHLTLGGRLYDAVGSWQWELEAAWQWGESRATPLPSDTNDLDHRAALVHAEVSRGFDGPGQPRVFLKYDYASGDSDPFDGKMQRFDTLFAARARDFGLLGIFGPFFFSNISSPALGVKMTVAPGVSLQSFYRPAWLAEKRDIFFGTALVDPAGGSGDFLGHQFDLRVDWELLPDQLSLMFGAAYLAKGEFLEDAPRAPGNGDTVYGVTQFTFRF